MSSSNRSAGRPEVGRPVNLRLGDDLLKQVDDYAARNGHSRAEAIRRLVAAGLTMHGESAGDIVERCLVHWLPGLPPSKRRDVAVSILGHLTSADYMSAAEPT